MGSYKDHKYYDVAFAERKHYHANWRESYYVPVWEYVFLMLEKSSKILEVGCGPGQFAAMLYEYGFNNYLGFDFSQVAIDLARKASRQIFYHGDARHPDNFHVEYDTIICLETLEHADDLAILKNIKQGATVIFSVPDFDDPAHVRYFTDIKQVRARYESEIDFKSLVKFDRFFIGKGIKK